MFKKFLLTLLIALGLFFNQEIEAQINHGGKPFMWSAKSVDLSAINFIKTAKLDMAPIIAEDKVVDQYKETPYRFGIDLDVNYDFFENASLTLLKNGDKLWQMGIHCPEATSINFIFGEYDLPDGASVFVWSTNRDEFLGSFTNQNNVGHHKLAVGLVHNDKIVIEYREPANVTTEAKLSIEQISHGYRPVINKWKEDKGPFGTSGSCNMNVNCPDGDPWQDEKRGVALILNGGSAWCTGSLINNTNEDGTPYFLTAAHCDANESNWVFYFNHEYVDCDNSGLAPTNQSISGATQVASTSPSDAHLILLNSDVPSEYSPYYNGWDRSGDPVSTAVGIHHPSGDVKKLAFDDDPLTITQYGSTTEGDYDHWRIEDWERSTTTEGGSSGSPLFDQNHRIIGQLHGGQATCSNSINDYYGAMHISFPFLADYLDPANSGVETLDGYGPYDVIYANDAQAAGFVNMPNFACSVYAFDPVFVLKNNGISVLTSATITVTYNNGSPTTISWVGSLFQNETEEITLPTFNPVSGNNTIEVSVTTAVDDNMNNNESNVSFSGTSSAAQGVDEINVYIIPDDYASETSWELRNPNGDVVMSGDSYSNGDTTPIDETYVIPLGEDGCFEFVIMDAYGDGICCQYGEGSYSITDGDGNELASGGEFTDEESALMSMTTAVGVDEVDFANQISVYPNPANDYLSIDVNHSIGNYSLTVTNIVGQTVLFQENKSGLTSLNISNLNTGVYFIKINTLRGSKTQKIMIK